MMTLKQLETFYWVARLRGFVAAAEKLNSTQATVSMRIKDLEESLGVTLFDRSQRAAQLTPKGQELLDYAEQMLDLAAQIHDRVGDPEVLTVNFRLGVTELVAVTWLPELMRAISAAYPRVTVELGVDLTLIQQNKLASGALDLAILPGAGSIPGAHSISLGVVECDWMASPALGVPVSGVTAEEIAQWPVLRMTHESNLFQIIESWFDQNNVRTRRTYMCNSIGILGALAEAGLGVSYLPRPFFERQLRTGSLRAFEAGPELPDLEYFAVRQKRAAHPLAARIADLARQCSTFGRA